MATLEGKLAKVQRWLAEGEEKIGRSGKPVKSSLTDNEGAKMASSHGVIQGYAGVTVVDERHQVIVNAQAFGEAQEHALLRPMLERLRERLSGRRGGDVLHEASVSADSGFHTNDNSNGWPTRVLTGIWRTIGFASATHDSTKPRVMTRADRCGAWTRRRRRRRCIRLMTSAMTPTSGGVGVRPDRSCG